MNCPKCGEAMESGDVRLKAWGVGIAPQARLTFNDKPLLRDQYVPLVGLFRSGKGVPGWWCGSCKLLQLDMSGE